MALKKIHETTIENLNAYLDGQLDAPTAAAVEAHLASCAECAWEKETLEQTRRLLAQMPRIAPPRSFVLREAQVSAPARTGFFTSARMLYLRGATAVAGVLLAVVVAGDVWLRPAVMPAAPAEQQTEMATFSAAPQPESTEIVGMKLAAQEPNATPQPEGTALPPVAAPAPEDSARGLGGGGEPTAAVAGQQYGVNDQGSTSAPFWADLRIWRVAEGALGAMFVALVAITATGWRKIARLG